ncbi:MAG: BrnT family toxin [Proteobacteria bacterium]|nr:BrnT family toxin [Pseudomonadota bacterium]
MNFEWDENKARLNRRNHDIGFDEAKTVFVDPLARIFDDVWHSVGEYREIIIGNSRQGRLLLVCFTERDEENIRIISSREATTRERKKYEEHRQH